MPLRDEHGDIIGTFGISRDVTPLKEAQQALEQAYLEILALNDHLWQDNWRYYLIASLLSAPFSRVSADISATVREARNAPYSVVVLLKILPALARRRKTGQRVEGLMKRLGELYDVEIRQRLLLGHFSQITDTEAVFILNIREEPQGRKLCRDIQHGCSPAFQREGYVLAMGIGEAVATPDELRQSYDTAQQALPARRNVAEMQILTGADIARRKHEALMFVFPEDTEQQLMTSVLTGINYVEYLAKLRVKHAKTLLVEDLDRKIYDICTEVGFLTTDTFTRTFKRFEGISPRAYRQRELAARETPT